MSELIILEYGILRAGNFPFPVLQNNSMGMSKLGPTSLRPEE